MAVYELRDYRAVEGRGEAVAERLRAHVLPIFDRLGFRIVSLWRDADDAGRLVYVMEWRDREAMEDGWRTFLADREWERVRRESEADGPILERIERALLEPLDA
jgi:heme-degrading monooxygenase HmoA